MLSLTTKTACVRVFRARALVRACPVPVRVHREEDFKSESDLLDAKKNEWRTHENNHNHYQ